MKKITIKGPRVFLRSLELKDAPQFVTWFKDKEVTRYLLMQTGITLAEERKYIRDVTKKENEFNLAIIDENGVHIGGTGTRLDPRSKVANIGIVIGDKNAWGKGYAVEVISLVADYVFHKLRYQRLELLVFMNNKRALAVYKKIGLKLEGVKRRGVWNIITKKYEDEGMMSILKEEWPKKKK